MKNKGILLFDMDGTIADTDPMMFATFNVLYDKYKNGKRRPLEEIYYFSGPPIRDTLKKEFPEYDQQFMYEEFYRISKEFYPTHIFPFENEKDVLVRLKNEGYKLGVVTNKQHAMAVYVLEILDLKDVFDLVVGFDDVKKGKPDAEGVLKAIEYFKGTKEETMYVGDNDIDFYTAENAGVKCALVSDGPRELNPDLKPFIRFKNFLELEEKIHGKDL